jgi:hypothetical protein
MRTDEHTPRADRTIIDDVDMEVARKNFVRAAEIATLRGTSTADLRSLRLEALWQVASNRNAPGIKRLARRYGISMQELRRLLEERAMQLYENGDVKALGPCYDAITGRYLSFEEWMKVHTGT